METFNILGHQVSFDNELSVYANIHSKSIDFSDNFLSEYNSMQKQVTTMDELMSYIENITNFMNNQFKITTDEILNIFVKYQIFDKSNKDIISNCKSIYAFSDYMEKTMNNINKYMNSINQYRSALEDKAANMVSEAIDDGCISVLTTSVTTSIVTDLLNEKWHREGDRKRQKAYNHMMKDVDEVVLSKLSEYSKQVQATMQKDLYNYGISAITEMFDYGGSVLISENKMSSAILDNLQSEKSNNILENLERIQDENVKQEQLIVALQIYPFSINIHAKMLDYITDYTDDYLKLVKFLNCENIVLKICIQNCSNITSPDNKYMKLRKILDENNVYYQKHINNVISNTAPSSSSDTKEVAKSIYKFNDTETFYFDNEYKYVFDVFIYASYSIGTIIKQDRVNGHIIINRPISIWQMTPTTTIEITVLKIDENKTSVTIPTLAKTNGFLCSPIVWKDKLLKKAKQKI